LNYKDLIAEEKLKKEKAIRIYQIHRFIKRAEKDLEKRFRDSKNNNSKW